MSGLRCSSSSPSSFSSSTDGSPLSGFILGYIFVSSVPRLMIRKGTKVPSVVRLQIRGIGGRVTSSLVVVLCALVKSSVTLAGQQSRSGVKGGEGELGEGVLDA